MSLGDSIRSGTKWLFIGSTGGQVLTFLFGIVLARLLVPADFGVLVSIQIFTGLAGLLAGGGMGQALVFKKEVETADYNAVFTLQLLIGLLIYGFFFTIAPWLAGWYETPLFEPLIRISALSFLLRPFLNMPGNILQRQMRFKAQAGARVAALLVTNGVSISMAYAQFGVWSLIIGGLVGTLANIFLLLPFAGWRPALSGDFARARDMIRYGFLITAGDFIVYVRSQASNFILSKTLGASPLGLFNKASSLVLIPHTLVTGSVYKVMFRALSKERDNQDLSQYLYLRSLTLVCVYTWPAFLALSWLALPIIRFVYGENWVMAAEPMAWLALIGPFIILEILAGCVLAARNWLKREIPVQIAQLVVVSLGVVAGLPYGLLGVAIGASLANVYGAVHMTWLVSQTLAMPARSLGRALLPGFILTAPLGLLWYVLDHYLGGTECCGDLLYLLVMSGSGALLYMALFFMLPIEALAAEKKRWLKQLRLAKDG